VITLGGAITSLRSSSAQPLRRRYTTIGLVMTYSIVALIGITLATANAQMLSAASAGQNHEVNVFAAADDSSPLVETVRDGSNLAPIGEMTGAGGAKWFMVKTKSGNVGWIMASDAAEVKRIDDHFRALPRDAISFGPSGEGGSGSSTGAIQISGTGAITIPVRINGNKVSVPVTFNNGTSSVSGYLALDTGADQTMISKRMARDLRIPALGSGVSSGIGGAARTEFGRVESMKVGKLLVKNVAVSILDFSNDPRYEGLLGFDFLGRFQMSLDSDKQVMVLTPRK
jgi:aspartyl protease